MPSSYSGSYVKKISLDFFSLAGFNGEKIFFYTICVLSWKNQIMGRTNGLRMLNASLLWLAYDISPSEKTS